MNSTIQSLLSTQYTYITSNYLLTFQIYSPGRRAVGFLNISSDKEKLQHALDENVQTAFLFR